MVYKSMYYFIEPKTLSIRRYATTLCIVKKQKHAAYGQWCHGCELYVRANSPCPTGERESRELVYLQTVVLSGGDFVPLPGGHLIVSRDIFSCPSLDGGATEIYWVEAREAAPHRAAPNHKEPSASNVNSANTETWCSKTRRLPCTFYIPPSPSGFSLPFIP